LTQIKVRYRHQLYVIAFSFIVPITTRCRLRRRPQAASGGSLAASEYDEDGFGDGCALVTQFPLENLFIACSELLKSPLAS
jgi:hypothetical protein